MMVLQDMEICVRWYVTESVCEVVILSDICTCFKYDISTIVVVYGVALNKNASALVYK